MIGLRRASGALVVSLLVACSSPVPVPQAPVRSAPLKAWDAVLDAVVDGRGHLDRRAVVGQREAIGEFVAWLGLWRPPRVRRAVGREAFWLNALDAMVLHAALTRWPDGAWPDGAWATIRQDTMPLDGAPMRLIDVADWVVRVRMQDHRAAVAVHRLSPDDPPWPHDPWNEQHLDAELDAAMVAWLNDPEVGASAGPEGLGVPAALAGWAEDIAFQTLGGTPCDVVSTHGRGALRRAAEAERVTGCRWHVRDPGAGGSGGR